MKISEILWRAANERLWDGGAFFYETVDEFSCNAVRRFDEVKAFSFLYGLGCNWGGGREFDEFPPGPERQGARYAWLMFASMYAEELGM